MGLMDKIVEQHIKKAIEDGAFDNLEGFGKPIPEEILNESPLERMVHSIMKNANILPEEMEIRKEMHQLRQQIQQTKDANKRRALFRQLMDKETVYKVKMEKRRR